jgi:hypothetical protein
MSTDMGEGVSRPSVGPFCAISIRALQNSPVFNGRDRTSVTEALSIYFRSNHSGLILCQARGEHCQNVR